MRREIENISSFWVRACIVGRDISDLKYFSEAFFKLFKAFSDSFVRALSESFLKAVFFS